jgi:hypothetical protein
LPSGAPLTSSSAARTGSPVPSYRLSPSRSRSLIEIRLSNPSFQSPTSSNTSPQTGRATPDAAMPDTDPIRMPFPEKFVPEGNDESTTCMSEAVGHSGESACNGGGLLTPTRSRSRSLIEIRLSNPRFQRQQSAQKKLRDRLRSRLTWGSSRHETSGPMSDMSSLSSTASPMATAASAAASSEPRYRDLLPWQRAELLLSPAVHERPLAEKAPRRCAGVPLSPDAASHAELPLALDSSQDGMAWS